MLEFENRLIIAFLLGLFWFLLNYIRFILTKKGMKKKQSIIISFFISFIVTLILGIIFLEVNSI